MTRCSGDGSRFDPATQLRVCAGSSEGSTVRVAVYGAVDLHTAPQLRAVLTSVVRAGAPGDLLVDLDGLAFGGAECVSTLLEARAALQRDGRSLRLINVPRFFKRVLAACRLEHLTG
jgi:anti-anti-sigma factor